MATHESWRNGRWAIAEAAAAHDAHRLLGLALEAVQSSPRSDLDGAPAMPVRWTPEQAVLMTLLTYSYAAGIVSSREIERRQGYDPVVRYICAGARFDTTRIRLFRAQYREVIRSHVARVLSDLPSARHGFEWQAPAGPRRGASRSSRREGVRRQIHFEEAGRRIRQAMEVDGPFFGSAVARD